MKSQKQEINKILYPEVFNSDYIYTYNTFNKELKDLIEESGQKKNFSRVYRKNLQFLTNLKRNCIFQKSFEQLKDNNRLYSMRFVGEKNIRILFSFFYINNKEIAILLCCFQEKDNKKLKSSDSYNKAIVIAEKRIDELISLGLKLC